MKVPGAACNVPRFAFASLQKAPSYCFRNMRDLCRKNLKIAASTQFMGIFCSYAGTNAWTRKPSFKASAIKFPWSPSNCPRKVFHVVELLGTLCHEIAGLKNRKPAFFPPSFAPASASREIK